MKNIPDSFRIVTLLTAIGLGAFAMATIAAEALTQKTQGLSAGVELQGAGTNEGVTDFAATIAPLRGDLLAEIAVARAASVIKPDKATALPATTATRERALTIAKKSLSLSPHASRIWLLTAMLQTCGQAQSDAIKMSYLTSPADVDLIAARLALVSKAILDDGLKNLARGDIRLILTRRPELKPAISSAFGHASADGKAYIADAVRSLDADFATSLR